MKKRLLPVLVALMMLTGCGQAGDISNQATAGVTSSVEEAAQTDNDLESDTTNKVLSSDAEDVANKGTNPASSGTEKETTDSAKNKSSDKKEDSGSTNTQKSASDNKTDNKSGSKTDNKTDNKSSSKTENKSSSKTDNKTDNKSNNKSDKKENSDSAAANGSDNKTGNNSNNSDSQPKENSQPVNQENAAEPQPQQETAPSTPQKPDYGRIIFTGDSRTVDMFYADRNEIWGESFDGIPVYCRDACQSDYMINAVNSYGMDNFDTLVTWMGCNDYGNFSPYESFYNTLLQQGKNIVVCTVGPTDNNTLANDFDREYYTNERQIAYNSSLINWANSNNVKIIDLYSYISGNGNLYINPEDGIHYMPQPTT